MGIPTFLDDVVSTSRQVALLAELRPGARIIVPTATDEVVLPLGVPFRRVRGALSTTRTLLRRGAKRAGR